MLLIGRGGSEQKCKECLTIGGAHLKSGEEDSLFAGKVELIDKEGKQGGSFS